MKYPKQRLKSLLLGLTVGLAAVSGCKKGQESASSAVTSPAYQRGKTIYQTQCIACHNTDPKKPGNIGPDVYGSSKDLLELRILKGEYPKGYTPKRSTKAMAPLPHLSGDIDAIYEYLNSPLTSPESK